jgi:hypothetical protein
MAPDLQPRRPGSSLPDTVRDAAARAGHRRRPIDLLLLAQIQDALARLPGQASNQHYLEIPGDCLASRMDRRNAMSSESPREAP